MTMSADDMAASARNTLRRLTDAQRTAVAIYDRCGTQIDISSGVGLDRVRRGSEVIWNGALAATTARILYKKGIIDHSGGPLTEFGRAVADAIGPDDLARLCDRVPPTGDYVTDPEPGEVVPVAAMHGHASIRDTLTGHYWRIAGHTNDGDPILVRPGRVEIIAGPERVAVERWETAAGFPRFEVAPPKPLMTTWAVVEDGGDG